MPENKTKTIIARCLPSQKAMLEQIAKEKHTTTSNLLISLIEEFIRSYQADLTPSKSESLCPIDHILSLNGIWNTINLDPNIPSHTKDKIQKEMNKTCLKQI